MSMRLPACALFAALFASAAAVAQVDAALAQGRLAVLDFRNKLADPGEVDAPYFADVVRSAALKALPGLRVITRENLLVLLESSGKKIEECEGECEVDTGRRIGADLVISGDLLKVGTNYKLNLRLHETRGGQLVSGTAASGKTVDELDANMSAAVAELLRPLQAAAGQPPVTRRIPEMHDSAPLAATAPDQPRSTNPTARKVGFGLVAGSALCGAGAGYFALNAQNAADSKAANTRAYVLAGAGGAALIAGVVLVLLNPSQPEVATLSPDGLVVAGRF
jgi:hypothetical protein